MLQTAELFFEFFVFSLRFKDQNFEVQDFLSTVFNLLVRQVNSDQLSIILTVICDRLFLTSKHVRKLHCLNQLSC